MKLHPETSLPLAISAKFADKYDTGYSLAGNESTMEAYWAEQAKAIDWYKEPDVILDKSNAPFYTWFKGGVMNASYNCIDRHVRTNPKRKALIYENSFGFPSAEYTYSELLDKVSRLAGVFCDHGVQKGDVVMIYMPNIPEAMLAILACARIGAIHYTVFAGLGVDTLTDLIKSSNPKLILLSSFTMASNKVLDLKVLIDQALKKINASGIKKIIVQRESYKVDLIEGEDYEFYKELSMARPQGPVALSSTDPLFLLNTAGTTGRPKGLLYENASYIVGAYAAMKAMGFDRGNGIVFMSNSGLAWIVGILATTYGCLLSGGTSILFEGDLVATPDIPWSLCEKYGVTYWLAYPSAIRTLKKVDPDAKVMHKFDLSALQCIAYGGERMDKVTEQWLQDKVPQGCRLTEAYGQTEIGTACLRCHKPLPGMRFVILDDKDKPMVINKTGRICIELPMSPGFAVSLNNSKDEFYKKYLAQSPGYYTTGDLGCINENGELHITGRADDVIVSMGRNVSASQVEDIIIQHPDVAETAVARGPHQVCAEVPYAFIVLKKDVKRETKKIENECVEKAIDGVGPWFSYFSTSIVVDELPKSRSGKLLRRVLKNILYGEEVQNPDTLINPQVLDGIRKRVQGYGIQTEIDVKIDESIM